MHHRLESVNRIILSVGHGGLQGESYDPGAVDTRTGITENAMCKIIVQLLGGYLTASGLPVLILPDYGLRKSFTYVNTIGDAHTDWAIEMHKDSAQPFNPAKLARRMGVYFHPLSSGSGEIASALAQRFLSNGARSSWAWPDTVSNHGQLGWIRKPKMLSHIIEAGFIQDDNSPAANDFYARTIAKSICHQLERPFIG